MATFIAQTIADAFIGVYLNGLRDVRNPALAGYYAETPRSLPTSEDVEERYQAIQDSVADDALAVVQPASEFTSTFPVSNGLTVFSRLLSRQGLEITLVQDLEVDEEDSLSTQNAELIDLSIQQESRGGVIAPDYLRQILTNSKLPGLDITEVNHFVEDEYPNDGFDADRKAFERAKALTKYITDLLGGLE